MVVFAVLVVLAIAVLISSILVGSLLSLLLLFLFNKRISRLSDRRAALVRIFVTLGCIVGTGTVVTVVILNSF